MNQANTMNMKSKKFLIVEFDMASLSTLFIGKGMEFRIELGSMQMA